MNHNDGKIPIWVWAAALLILLAQAGVAALLVLGKLPGASRNLVFQAMLGGAIAYVLLAGYVWKYHRAQLPRPPARLAVLLLVIFALALCGLQMRSLRPLLRLDYDVAAWSEPMFLMDIIKWRTGAPLYASPEDSNSNMYSFAAPAVTYFLAKISGHPTSVVAYRWIQLCFLVAAALLAVLCVREVLRLGAPELAESLPCVWYGFFFPAAFLFALNPQTGAFNVFLHNDPLSLLMAAACLFVLLRYLGTGGKVWLAAMVVMPALAFSVKQFHAIWAAVFAVCLLFEPPLRWKRAIVFAAASFGLLLLTVAASLAHWGANYRYWIFTIMGQHTLSVEKLIWRFSEAAPFLLPGVLGGWYFLRGERREKFLGLWCGWLAMILGGLYTSSITYSPTHLAAAALVGLSLGLAALAAIWPSGAPPNNGDGNWLKLASCVVGVLLAFGAFGVLTPGEYPVTPDLHRYVSDIEREFAGVPMQRVLLDSGEWYYLRHDFLARDRLPIFVTHQRPHWGLLDRIRQKEYDRILAHVMSNGKLAFDLGSSRGVEQALKQNYHEVRRIAAYGAKDDWRYRDIFLTEVIVFEPNP